MKDRVLMCACCCPLWTTLKKFKKMNAKNRQRDLKKILWIPRLKPIFNLETRKSWRNSCNTDKAYLLPAGHVKIVSRMFFVIVNL